MLASHLAIEGDLPNGGLRQGHLRPWATTYTQELSDAVKHYQARHGYTVDGQLTPQTVASLNVPMSQRVEQMNLALERWRWLPEPYDKPRVLENLAEYTRAHVRRRRNGSLQNAHSERPVRRRA